ncbi:hypothetical protein MLPM_1607 [Mycobacterium lepromatosis]|uniref:Uncharacterized protein n=1 Tax=Mycobacterium lepromatosis TaxID=480418 RepID=A0A0F4EQ77_9MYCO|nr:hypothetical protein MLPM_1607 [Mycobacterium lepromatosis]
MTTHKSMTRIHVGADGLGACGGYPDEDRTVDFAPQLALPLWRVRSDRFRDGSSNGSVCRG